MGIKGIYKEIGTGKRISLTKLAIEKLEETGRPLRLAIDISIWQFQVQAARGGSNPAIRTLFYRLLRLLSLSIQPIFVFDGPNKPAFKRNKRSGRGDGVATSMAKRLIRLFGFQVHDAPGEAEAECALLQQSGIVDAVLSEDVDTIMFGCTRTLRNWSSEGTKGSKTPTHVSMYDTEELREGGTGLDREGMVLVALMSGGDYLPEGIPGAGVKLACEAARAGFGKSLCRLKRSDISELASWKEWLTFELRHNESGFFRTRHKALGVPDDFPNLEVLRYYTHPVVSPASTLDRLRGQRWDKELDVLGLREFVRETFDWNYRIGATKFIRVLAPGLLVRKLMSRSMRSDQATKNLEDLEKEESELIKSITSRRAHMSTDATAELRMSFVPTNIVGYDFQEEPDEVIDYGRDGLALNSDDEFEALGEEEEAEAVTKTTSRKPFSPTEPELHWIPETIAKLGAPIMVEDWEAAQRAKVSRQKTKAPKQKAKANAGITAGALDKFVKVTKAIPPSTETNKDNNPLIPRSPSPLRSRTPLGASAAPSQSLPPPSIFSSSSQLPPPPQKAAARATRSSKQSKSKTQPLPRNAPDPAPNASTANPWTIAGSQVSPRVTRNSNSSNSKTGSKTTTATAVPDDQEAILISSSPPASPGASRGFAVKQNQQLEPEPEARSPDRRIENTEGSSPWCSRRRPATPAHDDDEVPLVKGSGRLTRALSPAPKSTENPRRKLARTESLPVASSPGRSSAGGSGRARGGLARAQTVAVEAPLSDDDGDEDEEFDLPPLSSIVGRVPQGNSPNPLSSRKSYGEDKSSKSTAHPIQKQKPGTKQSTLDASFTTTKTTKLYVPRKSEPGFFREVEVSVEEAEAWQSSHAASTGGKGKRGAGAAAWRRSDVSCIDLTGED
ncbi:hypothetical protein F5B20DRAFT_524672 [Whalleya microplaca]|nr:hypothetical protein F5B20DRAFT_524672 [Whalleya microplaca]